MAEYPSIVLTNSGLEMIAESQAGQNLIFTKLKIGDGSLAVGESISALTGVKSPKLDIPIQGFTNQGNGQVRLRYLVDNSGVAVNQGFFAREVGIYAKIGEVGAERLYAYTNGGNKVDWIPDKNTPLDAQIFDVFVLIGNASNVTVVINGSATYATKLDLTEHEDDASAHGEVIAAHNTDDHAHAALLRLWQPGKNYVKGDTYRPVTLSYPSWIYLECIQDGTSGANEPVWGAVGSEITDGTAKWRIRDVKSAGGVGIGTVLPFLATQAQPGWLALDTGAEVSRAVYPDLWEWVQANHPPITESAWQAQAAVQSSIGFYSSGDGSTTFRLPRILDYQRGALPAEVGQWQEDMFKSHIHSYTGISGSHGVGNGSNSNAPNSATLSTTDAGGDETRPKTIKFLMCVKAFDALTNPELINVTELANYVNMLSTQKQEITKYAILNELQPSGTDGGTFTAGAWRQRILNNKPLDDIGITLDSNNFTLPAGTYIVEVLAPGQSVGNHFVQLYNVTDNIAVMSGPTAGANSSYGGFSLAVARGKLLLSAAKTYRVEHFCTSSRATIGFGGASGITGRQEVYTTVDIRKVG